MPSSKPISPISVASLLVIAGTYLALTHHDPEHIRDFASAWGSFGPLLFVLLKIGTNVILPIGGTPYFLAAEPLFGLRWGFTWLFLGNLTGHTISFFLSRYVARDLARVLEPAVDVPLSGYKPDQSSSPEVSLLHARLFMFGLQDLASYAAGLTSISFRTYFLMTACATFAHMFVGMAIGRALLSSHPMFLAAYSVLTLFILPAFWVRVHRGP